MWYAYGKTLAEDAARKFLNENNIDLIVINPAVVIGPLLQPDLNTSASAILDLTNGKFFFDQKKNGNFYLLMKVHFFFLQKHFVIRFVYIRVIIGSIPTPLL